MTTTRACKNTCGDICSNIGCIGMLLIGMFLITRLHMLHSAVMRMQAERENEAWLFEQCKRDDFYHNLKQHSSLCDDVNARAQDAVLLHAVREVIENTYMFQFEFCTKLLDNVLNFCGKHVFYVSIIMAVFLIMGPALLVPHWRRCMNTISDHKTRQLYNCPYGDLHYVNTHNADYEFRRLQRVTNVDY
jgi:hypothetical protein